MKQKKVLALLLTSAMVLGTSMQAFAATGVSSGDATWEGEGEVNAVDTTVYSVTLPTDAVTTKLIIDPQGIMQMKSGDTASADDLAGAAGRITCESIPMIANTSSVPMKVGVSMQLSGDATDVSAINEVEADDETNVLLYAVPSAVDAKSADATKYSASSNGFVIHKSAPTDLEFILDAAEYQFEKDATTGAVTYKLADGSGHATGVEFAGFANKKADWSEFVAPQAPLTGGPDKKVGMKATFSFTSELKSGDVADTTEGAPYAMKAYSGDVVDLNAGPSVANVTYSRSKGGALTVPCNLGMGSNKATRVTDAVVVGSDKKLYSANGAWNSVRVAAVTVSDDSFTLSESWMKGMQDGESQVSVVFDGDLANYVAMKINVVN